MDEERELAYGVLDVFMEQDELQTVLGAYWLVRKWRIEAAIKHALAELRGNGWLN